MKKANLAKWTLGVPVLGTWVLTAMWNNPVEALATTIEWGKNLVEGILQAWDSVALPLATSLAEKSGWLINTMTPMTTLSWWVSAGVLSNALMNDLWVEKKWLKYWVNTVATITWFAVDSAIAPYIAAWGLSYAIWRHGWKISKGALKRVWWTAWGLTWWIIKWWAVGWWNSVKAWVKWEQKLNPVI